MTLPKTFRRIATIRTLCRDGYAVSEPDKRVEVTFTILDERNSVYGYVFADQRGYEVRDGYPYAMVEHEAFKDVFAVHRNIIVSWTDPDVPAP